MLNRKVETKEYHENGTLWFVTIIGIIEPIFYDLYKKYYTNKEGERFIKLKCQKFYNNNQFAWSLIWDEWGVLLNNDESQFRFDGTIIQL
ncbi:MAG: hypothetical protein LH615_04035 [Ferruginibacter sp.]|nr:hypothetical protein [Ferruginibacter sp.]